MMVERTEKAMTDNPSENTEGVSKESRSTLDDNARAIGDLDGGWAWMVCLSCYVVNFIVDGLVYSFGVIQLKLLDRFEDSRSKTSWVGSTFIGFTLLIGPVVSVLLEFYSCRQVMVLGSLVSFVGFGLCLFAPNVETLVFTLGVLGGAGLGLVFLSSVLAVGLHFTTRRALATGIATSGSGLGTLVLSYLTERLLDFYGWQGAMLLLCGLVLNCVLCGVVVRPLIKRDVPAYPCCQKFKNKNDTAKPYNEREMSLQIPSVVNEPKCSNSNERNTQCQEKTRSQELEKVHMDLNSEEITELMRSREYTLLTVVDQRKYKSDCHLHKLGLQKRGELDTNPRKQKLNVTTTRQDICYSGSIFNLPEYQRDPGMISFLTSMSSLSSNRKLDLILQKKSFVNSYKDLLCDKVFLMLIFVMISWTGMSSVLMFLPDMAVSKGISRTTAALLVSMVGGTNIIGRVLAGFLANHPSIDSVALCTGALFLSCITSAVFPFCSSLWMFIVCSFMYGISVATCFSLRTIVLADVLGISKLTKSLGVVAFLQGLVYIFGPPLSGVLFDTTGSFIPPYILTAIVYGVAGVTCALIRPVERWLHKPNIKTDEDESCIGDKTCQLETATNVKT